MKILMVCTQTSGHQETYINGLLNAVSANDTVKVIAPGTADNSLKLNVNERDRIRVDYENDHKVHYLKWATQIRRVVRSFEPDVIHFVYGDDLYRYFGLGLRWIAGKANTIVTCHQIRRSRLRDLSLKRIGKCSDLMVVHTKQLTEDLKAMGIRNVRHIEYPRFITDTPGEKGKALQKLGLNVSEGTPVLLALGGTREDKGLDILLAALKKISIPFHLIIAGKEEHFKRDYIRKQTEDYAEKTTVMLQFLSDETMSDCLSAADIIALPYRKQFDGASGPLGEGVWYEKQIIGPDHGSLGRIISENHLGKTFHSEDINSLSETLLVALKETDWTPDKTYMDYRMQLDPQVFSAQYSELYHMEVDKA